jgi:hypothetical protein
MGGAFSGLFGSLSVVLWTSLFTVVVPMVIRVLYGLGVGFVTYTGFEILMGQGEAYVMAHYSGIPADALAITKIAGVDQALHIIFAAWSAQLTIRVALGAMERYRARPSSLRA